MCACLRNRFDDARPFILLTPTQLLLESLKTTACHRHLVHSFTFPAVRTFPRVFDKKKTVRQETDGTVKFWILVTI
jgi:hypothetical protein